MNMTNSIREIFKRLKELKGEIMEGNL